MGVLLVLFVIFMVVGGVLNAQDTKERHESQYGRVARCPHCNSTNCYMMNYDDKYMSVNFWGAASSKIGKLYHCDNCGYEW